MVYFSVTLFSKVSFFFSLHICLWWKLKNESAKMLILSRIQRTRSIVWTKFASFFVSHWKKDLLCSAINLSLYYCYHCKRILLQFSVLNSVLVDVVIMLLLSPFPREHNFILYIEQWRPLQNIAASGQWMIQLKRKCCYFPLVFSSLTKSTLLSFSSVS